MGVSWTIYNCDPQNAGVIAMLYLTLRRVASGALFCCALVSMEVHAGSASDRAVGDTSTVRAVLHWNTVAIDASGLDHTPVEYGDDRVYGEALGPGRSARAMAIVHIAIFDAMLAVQGGYQPYTNIPRVADPSKVSIKAAIAQAAHDTLIEMFPSQRASFERELQASMSQLPEDTAAAGSVVGADAAERILKARRDDGSGYAEPTMGNGFDPSDKPGWWRADPVSGSRSALGAYWGKVTPFVMTSSTEFRVPPPPEMSSQEYTDAYEEVMRLGGDGVTTPTQRTEEQTFIGIYWAYDGMPSLCAPPRLYNQIAAKIARQRGTSALQTARLLALVNVSLAESGIAIWESKFHYQFWRPVTAIRESDEGNGPTSAGDGNPATAGDPKFMPLGAPASNRDSPNFTPPFPSYPSGHAGFGGALFQTLRRFYRTDEIAFTFVSDEYNGITRDNQGNVRQLHSRSFKSLSQAEQENARSRIYLGIHWEFDASEGITQGEQVADYVFDRIYRPTRK
jgi:hypothetical protein